jgi:hypothetical protein
MYLMLNNGDIAQCKDSESPILIGKFTIDKDHDKFDRDRCVFHTCDSNFFISFFDTNQRAYFVYQYDVQIQGDKIQGIFLR